MVVTSLKAECRNYHWTTINTVYSGNTLSLTWSRGFISGRRWRSGSRTGGWSRRNASRRTSFTPETPGRTTTTTTTRSRRAPTRIHETTRRLRPTERWSNNCKPTTVASTLTYTVKISLYPRYFVASCPYFSGTGFVSVSRRNNKDRPLISMWARASLFRRFKDTKRIGCRQNMENSPQNISRYRDNFYSAFIHVYRSLSHTAAFIHLTWPHLSWARFVWTDCTVIGHSHSKLHGSLSQPWLWSITVHYTQARQSEMTLWDEVWWNEMRYEHSFIGFSPPNELSYLAP